MAEQSPIQSSVTQTGSFGLKNAIDAKGDMSERYMDAAKANLDSQLQKERLDIQTKLQREQLMEEMRRERMKEDEVNKRQKITLEAAAKQNALKFEQEKEMEKLGHEREDELDRRARERDAIRARIAEDVINSDEAERKGIFESKEAELQRVAELEDYTAEIEEIVSDLQIKDANALEHYQRNLSGIQGQMMEQISDIFQHQYSTFENAFTFDHSTLSEMQDFIRTQNYADQSGAGWGFMGKVTENIGSWLVGASDKEKRKAGQDFAFHKVTRVLDQIDFGPGGTRTKMQVLGLAEALRSDDKEAKREAIQQVKRLDPMTREILGQAMVASASSLKGSLSQDGMTDEARIMADYSSRFLKEMGLALNDQARSYITNQDGQIDTSQLGISSLQSMKQLSQRLQEESLKYNTDSMQSIMDEYGRAEPDQYVIQDRAQRGDEIPRYRLDPTFKNKLTNAVQQEVASMGLTPELASQAQKTMLDYLEKDMIINAQTHVQTELLEDQMSTLKSVRNTIDELDRQIDYFNNDAETRDFLVQARSTVAIHEATMQRKLDTARIEEKRQKKNETKKKDKNSGAKKERSAGGSLRDAKPRQRQELNQDLYTQAQELN